MELFNQTANIKIRAVIYRRCLRDAGGDNHAWVREHDSYGRARRLMKCGSIEWLHTEAQKQLARMRQQNKVHVAKANKALTIWAVR